MRIAGICIGHRWNVMWRTPEPNGRKPVPTRMLLKCEDCGAKKETVTP